MPLRNTFPEAGNKTGGVARLSGAFTVNGASAPDATLIVGEGFTVGAPSTGVYTVTLLDGPVKAALACHANLSEGGANSSKRAFIGSKANLSVNGTFTIVTQSAAGTDANLSAGEIVDFEINVINMG